MAKHCEVCRQSYADEHDTCPHCAAAESTPASSAPHSAPEIPRASESPPAGGDSGIVLASPDTGAAADFAVLEGSSMDIDLGSSRRSTDSGIAIPAADAGPPSDIVDLDWSAVAESSAKHPPLVNEPPSEETRAEPEAAPSGDESSTVDLATLLASSPSGSSAESEEIVEVSSGQKVETGPEDRSPTETPPEQEVVAATHAAHSEDDSSAPLGQHISADIADSSMVDLGSRPSYRDRDEDDDRHVDSVADISLPAPDESESPAPVAMEATDSVRPQAAPSRGTRGWVGGGMVGLLVGAAACVGLWAVGIEPPQSLRAWLGKAQRAATVPSQGLPLPQNGGHVVAKGSEVFWVRLAEAHRNGATFKQDDPAVVQFRRVAARTGGPEGQFQIGLVEEICGDFRAARKAYAHGLEESQRSADRRRFQAALDRIDTRTDLSRPEGAGALAPSKNGSTATASGLFDPLRAAVVGLLLPAAPAVLYERPNASDEPGFHFWRALRQAQEQHYVEALSELEQARKIYDQGRFEHHGEGQNPNSDPTEEIFLRCCDELHHYWLVRQKLTSAGYLDAAKQPNVNEAVEKLLKSASSGGLDSLAHELRGDPVIRANDPELKHVDQDIKLVLDAGRKATAELSAIRKMLDAAGGPSGNSRPLADAVSEALVRGTAAEKQLATVSKALHLSAHESVSPVVTKLIADREAERDHLARITTRAEQSEALLRAALKRMTTAGLLAPGSGPDKLLVGVDKLLDSGSAPVATALAKAATTFAQLGREAAERSGRLVDLSGRLAAARLEAARLHVMLAQGHPPEQMLAIWARVVGTSSDLPLAQDAIRDADRVLQSTGAAATTRAKAVYVRALALKNASKFEEARQAFRQALAGEGSSAWSADARARLAELSDVHAYYLPRIQSARRAGNLEQASGLLHVAMQVFTDQAGRARSSLLAERSLVRLELARSQAQGRKLTAADVAAATADAKAAGALGAKAEAAFAEGQIAAALGEWAAARAALETAYRSATSTEAARNEYRLALAQALLHMTEPRGLAASYSSRTGDTGNNPMTTAPPRLNSSSVRVQALAALLVLTVDGSHPVADRSALEQAKDLADEAIRSGDPHGYLILAQVLARQDQWTAALQQYLHGMEQISQPRALTRTLHRLVDEHPAFRMPDTLKVAQPELADKHYSVGLGSYWSGDYQAAAREFSAAVHDNGDDARYRYFLGLAWLHQDRRADALEAFREAGLLEKQQLPDSGAVNIALERIQASDRELLDQYRR